VSAPAPDPWRSDRDKDADALGLLTAALADDEAGAVFLLSGLDREQLVQLVGVIAMWAVWALEHAVDDPAEHLRVAALRIAEGGE
jgi:hypothetical protein